jgi:hypothetical protein
MSSNHVMEMAMNIYHMDYSKMVLLVQNAILMINLMNNLNNVLNKVNKFIYKDIKKETFIKEM